MASTTLDVQTSALANAGASGRALQWSSRVLTATVWISAGLFGLYILAFYAAAFLDGNLETWNQALPRLYETNTPTATAAIGIHFAAGGIILAGREIDGPGPDRGVVFQAPCLLPWMTALANVRLGVDQVFADRPVAERVEVAAQALYRVGLHEALDKRPGELSAGMRQRPYFRDYVRGW